jgi:hypothetical protein
MARFQCDTCRNCANECLCCQLIREEFERNLAVTRREQNGRIFVRPFDAAGGMLGTQADRERWREARR